MGEATRTASATGAMAAIAAVAMLALVTLVTRVGGVWLMSQIRITRRVETFLRYMSVSVLIAIVAPAAWAAAPHIGLGVAMAALVMAATRSALSAMLAGTALAAVARGLGL